MRLIDADALDFSYENVGGTADGCSVYDVEAYIASVPTIDAEPVRHGYWIIRGGDMWCSECGYGDVTEFGEPEDYHYCPHCGAKMGVEP